MEELSVENYNSYIKNGDNQFHLRHITACGLKDMENKYVKR